VKQKEKDGSPDVLREEHKKKENLLILIKKYMKLEKFIIPLNSEWKAFFDTSILIVIGYSCSTTVFYVAFDALYSKSAKSRDSIVTIFFAMDFVFNLM
jgi:hypothetical protein